MTGSLLRLLKAAAGLVRPAAALLLLALGCAGAQAATYAFRSDTYSWESTANTITGWDRTCTNYQVDDDKVTLGFTGGFAFPFAGTSYTSVRVLSNGMLQFGADAGFHRTYTNTTLPAAAPGNFGGGCANAVPQNVIMGYWTDLNPAAGGTVTWQQKGTAPNRYFVVSWNNVPQYGTSSASSTYTFQIILFENGEFKYQYSTDSTSGSTATIGVQVSATDYTLYSYKSGYNAAGSAVRWFVASGAPSRLANYRFDEYSYAGVIGEVVDSTGSGHNGIAVGGAQTTAGGYVCRALNVPANTTSATNAVDSAVAVPSLLGIDGSVSFWVRSNVVWTSGTAALLFDATTIANRPFYLMRSGGGALKLAVADSAGTILSATSGVQNFAANTWVHVAATWRLASGTNASVLRLYVNGAQVAVANGTTNGVIDPSIGTLFFGDNRSNLTPSGGTVNSTNGAIDEASLYNYEISALEIAADMAVTHGCSTLHHVEIRGSASGLTCTPTTFTIAACQDSACTSGYTGGVLGTLSASGAGMTVNWPDGAGFNIPSGSSTVTARMQLTTAGSVSVTASGLSPGANSATTCDFGSPACSFTAADSGLLFDVPHHVAQVAQTVTVSAVKKSDSSLACVPAFAGVTKAVAFGCSYTNPSSGTLPVMVGGNAVSCGSTRNVSLAFNASGVATTTVQYADVGLLTLTAAYTGSGSDAGLTMTGSDTFVAAPADFGIGNLPSPLGRAGVAFSPTVTARNSAGAATPNFGRESPAATVSSSVVRSPNAGTLANGSLGAFVSGVATWSNLRWDDVGTLSFSVSTANYLGTGLGASGSASLRVVPHRFDVALARTAPCAGAFTYAGQPFTATVTALNSSGGTTANYTSGGAAQAVTLAYFSGAPPAGQSFTGGSIAATAFSAGVGSGSVTHAFTSKLTAPQSTRVRATDPDGVSSAAGNEATLPVRSGRLRIVNGFGSEKSPLALTVLAEYWTGSSWLKNGDDSGCAAIPAAAVAQSNKRDGKGGTGTWTTTASAVAIGSAGGGQGTLTLSAPTPAGSTGSVDLALNLGSTGADQSCLSSHPASTGAGLAWLRSTNGTGPDAACAAAPSDRDPAARASFGIYSPETRKTVHVRDIF
jgi:MSHA biogenesis protein MshQ